MSALVQLKRALISVSDKTGVIDFCKTLRQYDISLLSTGGTYKVLRDAGIEVEEVASVTSSPEILGGRVKTLHPKIHGGILAIRNNEAHKKDMEKLGIIPIDMIVVNLYPFEHTVANNGELSECVEQIDIGGPSMLRSSAKNFAHVLSVSSPVQYSRVEKELLEFKGSTSLQLRKQLALESFTKTSQYDREIENYLKKNSETSTTGDLGESSDKKTETSNENNAVEVTSSSTNGTKEEVEPLVTEWLTSLQTTPPVPLIKLKYGLNPQQIPSYVCQGIGSTSFPFTVLNGKPGYINFLDAAHGWQLVNELKITSDLPAAASFKHVSPSGVAIGEPLTDEDKAQFDLPESLQHFSSFTPVLCAIIRARNGDPLCSYGDFLAVNETVTEDAAMFLKTEVSDGIVAPGYTPEALSILSKKKSGSFVILSASTSFSPPSVEYRELFGMGLLQTRNSERPLGYQKIVTKNSDLSDASLVSLALAVATLKFTQSNSVCFVYGPQVVAVAAGQQSRVDAVKLCAKKSLTWRLRRSPPLLRLNFLPSLHRQARVNARVRYIEGSLERETHHWDELFQEQPLPLSQTDCQSAISELPLVASSDGFFPFRDSIDEMEAANVKCVAHPGGSVADKAIIEAGDEFNMVIVETGVRLFVH